MDFDDQLLNQGLEILSRAKEQERIAIDLRSRAYKILCRIVANRVGVDTVHLGFFWECPTSPTTYCIYNQDTDPMHDDCLFCHQPEERK